MSEAVNPQRRFNFGRVFFPGDPKSVPNEVRLQPLGDHVGNVRRLVKRWKGLSSDENSRKRVLKAADIHDMGKPQRFAIQVDLTPKGKFKNYKYSFRGHRFLAESPDLWAKTLARGHHDFSVRDISRDAYELRKDPDYVEILSRNPLAYAQELYILEMCDQIEAELACRILGDEEQAESRTFMDYTISKENDQTYYLDPWAFDGEEIILNFRYWSKPLSVEEKQRLQKLCDHGKENQLGTELDRIVKDWWHRQSSELKTHPIQITLKSFSQKYRVGQEHKQDVSSVYQRLGGFSPNLMQVEMFQALTQVDGHPAILLKAPTGSGKTESILFPALIKGYRLFLPLPARSLLEDQKERIEKYLLKFSDPQIFPENQDREISLVVDTGSQMYRWVYKNGKDITDTLKINLRRHLYKGDVILTTIDKFLYRYFSFGDKQKSFTFPLRINQDRTLICFDEAHSYDEISFTNFQSLVRSLYEAGRSLVLMTATMPLELAKRFDCLQTLDFTTNLFKQPTRSFEWIDRLICDRDEPGDYRNPDCFQEDFVEIVFNEWQARKQQSRIIVVAETVRDAVAIYQLLKSRIGCDTSFENRWLFLYHGRVADQLRPQIYQTIKQRDDSGQPYIVVTTSAIEVGCDLNAEVLISQICPPENLIQRAGRCNRKGNVLNAKVIVVGNRIPEFFNTLDDTGWHNYQEVLQSLTEFDTHRIGECIKRFEHIDDYRVVELFSMLHDYVYGADLTCQPIYEKGLVVTRSWTPSATLIYADGSDSPPRITVPIDRLTKKEDNQYENTSVEEYYYDQESSRRELCSLRWGSAYSKDIVVKVAPSHPGASMFEGHDEYSYDAEFGFVDLPGVFIKLRANGFEEKLLYQPNQGGKGKSVIITYTKALSNE